MIRFSIRSLLSLVTCVALLVAIAIYCLGPVVPESTLALIKPGASKQHVREVLGDPTSNSTSSSWYYDRVMNPGWLTVNFDLRGKVLSVDHERAFP